MAKLTCPGCGNDDMVGARFIENGVVVTYKIESGTGEENSPLKLRVIDRDNSDWSHSAICPKCGEEFDADYADEGEGDAFSLEFEE